jgi:hypothetical protein
MIQLTSFPGGMGWPVYTVPRILHASKNSRRDGLFIGLARKITRHWFVVRKGCDKETSSMPVGELKPLTRCP